MNVFKNTINAVRKTHQIEYKNYIANAILDVFFNNDLNLWNNSFLSKQLPLENKDLNDDEISKIQNMMKYNIEKYSIDFKEFSYYLLGVSIVEYKGDFSLTILSDRAKEFVKKYNLKASIEEWQKLID